MASPIPIPIPEPTPWVQNPNSGKSMPIIRHSEGTPQLPASSLRETVDRLGMQSSGANSIKGVSTGPIQGPVQQPQAPQGYGYSLPNSGDFYSGGGGGGGVSQAQLAQLRSQQEGLANTERRNIETRRDNYISGVEGAYNDQMSYLDTQTQLSQDAANRGRETVISNRDATIERSLQDAEAAARVSRDTYRDMILQGRRRARATGAGSSSGYLEMTNMLDQQLMRGLGQVEQTKQGQIRAANTVADQAVGQIEAELNKILGEITNNRQASLRERDTRISDARANAADALLEVDKWLTQTFSDIETAKAGLSSGRGGGSAPRFDKYGYAAAQSEAQGQILNGLNQYLRNIKGGYTPAEAQRAFQTVVPDLLNAGASYSDIKNMQGLYLGQNDEPDMFSNAYQGFVYGDDDTRNRTVEFLNQGY